MAAVTLPRLDWEPVATGNALLDSLPSAELALLTDDLRMVRMAHGTRLLAAGATVEFVDFPVTAVISLTTQTGEGDPIEVTMVGAEGVLGTWLTSNVDVAPWSAIVQVAGESLRVSRATFLRAIAEAPELREHVSRYALTQTFLMSQSVLCNRFHELPRRAARWLLILASKARTDDGTLPVTHEILSQMLGVHRPSVTLAL